ncbi:Sfi1 spindle body domain-containing protein [Plasmodiophora brassicae]
MGERPEDDGDGGGIPDLGGYVDEVDLDPRLRDLDVDAIADEDALIPYLPDLDAEFSAAFSFRSESRRLARPKSLDPISLKNAALARHRYAAQTDAEDRAQLVDAIRLGLAAFSPWINVQLKDGSGNHRSVRPEQVHKELTRIAEQCHALLAREATLLKFVYRNGTSAICRHREFARRAFFVVWRLKSSACVLSYSMACHLYRSHALKRAWRSWCAARSFTEDRRLLDEYAFAMHSRRIRRDAKLLLQRWRLTLRLHKLHSSTRRTRVLSRCLRQWARALSFRQSRKLMSRATADFDESKRALDEARAVIAMERQRQMRARVRSAFNTWMSRARRSKCLQAFRERRDRRYKSLALWKWAFVTSALSAGVKQKRILHCADCGSVMRQFWYEDDTNTGAAVSSHQEPSEDLLKRLQDTEAREAEARENVRRLERTVAMLRDQRDSQAPARRPSLTSCETQTDFGEQPQASASDSEEVAELRLSLERAVNVCNRLKKIVIQLSSPTIHQRSQSAAQCWDPLPPTHPSRHSEPMICHPDGQPQAERAVNRFRRLASLIVRVFPSIGFDDSLLDSEESQEAFCHTVDDLFKSFGVRNAMVTSNEPLLSSVPVRALSISGLPALSDDAKFSRNENSGSLPPSGPSFARMASSDHSVASSGSSSSSPGHSDSRTATAPVCRSLSRSSLGASSTEFAQTSPGKEAGTAASHPASDEAHPSEDKSVAAYPSAVEVEPTDLVVVNPSEQANKVIDPGPALSDDAPAPLLAPPTSSSQPVLSLSGGNDLGQHTSLPSESVGDIVPGHSSTSEPVSLQNLLEEPSLSSRRVSANVDIPSVWGTDVVLAPSTETWDMPAATEPIGLFQSPNDYQQCAPVVVEPSQDNGANVLAAPAEPALPRTVSASSPESITSPAITPHNHIDGDRHAAIDNNEKMSGGKPTGPGPFLSKGSPDPASYNEPMKSSQDPASVDQRDPVPNELSQASASSCPSVPVIPALPGSLPDCVTESRFARPKDDDRTGRPTSNDVEAALGATVTAREPDFSQVTASGRPILPVIPALPRPLPERVTEPRFVRPKDDDRTGQPTSKDAEAALGATDTAREPELSQGSASCRPSLPVIAALSKPLPERATESSFARPKDDDRAGQPTSSDADAALGATVTVREADVIDSSRTQCTEPRQSTSDDLPDQTSTIGRHPSPGVLSVYDSEAPTNVPQGSSPERLRGATSNRDAVDPSGPPLATTTYPSASSRVSSCEFDAASSMALVYSSFQATAGGTGRVSRSALKAALGQIIGNPLSSADLSSWCRVLLPLADDNANRVNWQPLFSVPTQAFVARRALLDIVSDLRLSALRLRCLRRAMTVWRRSFLRRCRLADAANSVERRTESRLLSTAFSTWRSRCRRITKAQQTLLRVFSSVSRRRMSSAWHRWRRSCEPTIEPATVPAERAVPARTVNRLYLHLYWLGWRLAFCLRRSRADDDRPVVVAFSAHRQQRAAYFFRWRCAALVRWLGEAQMLERIQSSTYARRLALTSMKSAVRLHDVIDLQSRTSARRRFFAAWYHHWHIVRLRRLPLVRLVDHARIHRLRRAWSIWARRPIPAAAAEAPADDDGAAAALDQVLVEVRALRRRVLLRRAMTATREVDPAGVFARDLLSPC